jgi:hypothetical protein
MAKDRRIAQTDEVRMGQHRLFLRVLLGAGLIFLGALSVSASTTPPYESRLAPSATTLQGRSFSDEMASLESLREDVGRHPTDFMRFETRIAANRFIAEHGGAYHETESRMVLRGVVGYWQGKTLVVLPSLSFSDVL